MLFSGLLALANTWKTRIRETDDEYHQTEWMEAVKLQAIKLHPPPLFNK